MPFKNNTRKLEYQAEWRRQNPDKVKSYVDKRNVSKRCPSCNRVITVRRDRKTRICPYCGVKIHVSRTYNDNPHTGHAHGVKLWVERKWSFKG